MFFRRLDARSSQIDASGGGPRGPGESRGLRRLGGRGGPLLDPVFTGLA